MKRTKLSLIVHLTMAAFLAPNTFAKFTNFGPIPAMKATERLKPIRKSHDVPI